MKESTSKTAKILKTAQKYFEEGEYDKALPLLTALIDQRYESEHLFHMLGVIYYEEGRFKPAIACFKKSLSINPGFTDSSIGLSVILNDLGKYEEAKKVFTTAQKRLKKNSTEPDLQLKSQIAKAHLKIASLYLEDQQPYKALENIHEHDNLTGQTKETLDQKVKIYRTLANFEKAIELIKMWADSHEPTSDIWFRLAETYYLNKQPLAALSTCEKLLKKFPQHQQTLKFYAKLKNTTFDLREKEF